jgi:hypothetical protein
VRTCDELKYYADYISDLANIEELLTGTLTGFISEVVKDLNRWLYRTLEKEYEYLSSDEAIIETIEANEYTFTESGKLENF